MQGDNKKSTKEVLPGETDTRATLVGLCEHLIQAGNVKLKLFDPLFDNLQDVTREVLELLQPQCSQSNYHDESTGDSVRESTVKSRDEYQEEIFKKLETQLKTLLALDTDVLLAKGAELAEQKDQRGREHDDKYRIH